MDNKENKIINIFSIGVVIGFIITFGTLGFLFYRSYEIQTEIDKFKTALAQSQQQEYEANKIIDYFELRVKEIETNIVRLHNKSEATNNKIEKIDDRLVAIESQSSSSSSNNRPAYGNISPTVLLRGWHEKVRAIDKSLQDSSVPALIKENHKLDLHNYLQALRTYLNNTNLSAADDNLGRELEKMIIDILERYK